MPPASVCQAPSRRRRLERRCCVAIRTLAKCGRPLQILPSAGHQSYYQDFTTSFEVEPLYAIGRVLKLSSMFICVAMHVLLLFPPLLLCFGDRKFYKDCWNAKTVDEYWRMWNMLQSNCCYRRRI